MISGRQAISLTKDWNTPQEYIDTIKQFFGVISLDPCSNNSSLVGAAVEYKLPANDGLKDSWDFPTIYVNPPYGKSNKTSIKHWLQRCTDANKQGSEVIALIPVATNTSHWQTNIFLNASSICFLKIPRLKFLLDGSVYDKGAPMACCLVYWGERTEEFESIFGSFGKVLHI